MKDLIKNELKTEILHEARSTFAPNSTEIKEGIEILEDKLRQEISHKHAAVIEDIKYERLKDQASAKKHNLLVFGLVEEYSSYADTRAVLSFFADRMDLPRIAVRETLRLGQLQPDQSTPRPLVVSFQNICDKWAVWNRRGSIKKDWNYPIWLQEDLPKNLREDNRVLNRIAKTARQKPDLYREVKIQDFKLTINDKTFGCDGVHLLPDELKPKAVYTPRTDHACVFFTRHSPLSNHHLSTFQVDGQSFVCVEQFLALRRAQLAGDDFLIQSALQQQDLADCKVILNTLRADQPDT